MKKYTILLLGLLLIAGLFGIYSNHFHNSFHFDDDHTIVNNVHIREISNIPEFFVNPKMFSSRPDHQGLRPIVTTTLAIDYWLAGGYDTFYFHLSTFLVFVLLGIFIFYIFFVIVKKSFPSQGAKYIALFAAAVYCYHTANAETINYVISRSDVLSTFFAVLTLGVYIRFRELRNWHLYLIPAVLGILSKEAMAICPILIFFYIYFFEEELSMQDLFKVKKWKKIGSIIVKLAPLIIVIASLQLYTLSKNHMDSGFSNPLPNYLLTQPYIWLHYFITFFFPFNLSADTDMTVFNNLLDDRVFIGLFFVIALVYFIFKTSRNKNTKPIAFGLIWFVVTLLPTSIVPLAEVTNDHRMLFPFIGLSLAIIYSLSMLIVNSKAPNRMNKILIASVCCLLLMSFGYGTYQRNKVWKDGFSLWHDVTIKSPRNGRGLMNYGTKLMGRGDYVEALDYYERAKVFNPYYSTLFINLGIVHNGLGNIDDAEFNFNKALQYGSNNSNSYFFYARYLNEHNRLDEAMEMAEKSHELNKYYLENEQLLLKVYEKLGLQEKLKLKAQEVLKFSKNDPLALAILQNKNIIESEVNRTFSARELVNLSLHYYNKGKYNECIDACYKAIKLDSNSHIAYNNICSAYNQIGEYQKAIKACEKALQINPDFTIANNNLKLAKDKLNL